MRLNQVTVPLVDYAASVEFYRKLGLKLIVDAPPRYARFEMPQSDAIKGQAGEPATFSIEKVEGWTGGDWPEIWFESDRLDELVADLKAKGLTFESEPETMSYLWRVAHLRDPAGNRITLYHAGEHRRFPPWRVG
ncbi:MAG TPA: VOC family protein [Hyphomonadaceae bacterium]|jgi:catechol 2,3-dioxygenase-like lactoylglutathione lyase family enzyme|nr:VOC family protein [Hyphomonadaceae bacterium]